jgi:hypothetical protein
MGLHAGGDIVKCALATASAKLMEDCCVPNEKIAIPFLVVTGNTMVFCVTRLLPGSQQPYVRALYNRRLVGHETGRLKIFACFALLLTKQYAAALENYDQSAANALAEAAIKMSTSSKKESSGVAATKGFTKTAKKSKQNESTSSRTTTDAIVGAGGLPL